MLKKLEQKEPLIRSESPRTYNAATTTKSQSKIPHDAHRIDDSKEFETTFDYMDFKCPKEKDVYNMLNKSRCTIPKKLSEKYAIFIEQHSKWDAKQLYEDLLDRSGELITFLHNKLNIGTTTQLFFKIMLIQKITELYPYLKEMVEHERLMNKYTLQDEEQIHKKEKEDKDRQSQLITYSLNAYNTISILAALIIPADVTLAVRKHVEFEEVYSSYIFNILVTMSIMCSLHALVVTRWIIYQSYRALGNDKVDYAVQFLKATYQTRNEVRISFVLGLILFTSSFCASYLDVSSLDKAKKDYQPLFWTILGTILIGWIFIVIRIMRQPPIHDEDGESYAIKSNKPSTTKGYKLDKSGGTNKDITPYMHSSREPAKTGSSVQFSRHLDH